MNPTEKPTKLHLLIGQIDRAAQNFNATGKAREDATAILDAEGYTTVDLYTQVTSSNLRKITQLVPFVAKVRRLLSQNNVSEVIVQYPPLASGPVFLTVLAKMLRRRGIPLRLLVHDLNSFRYLKTLSQAEKDILNRADTLIVHTPAMVELCRREGLTCKDLRILTLFDYRVASPNLNTPQTPWRIGFAGNLAKSGFLQHLGGVLGQHTLRLYGLAIDRQWPQGLEYVGKFKSDDLSGLDFEWGLVWDGDSIDACTGELGDYLRYNSSHKNSLYLAAGIPLIVWDQAALAPYVTSNGLGIAVGSLAQIPGRLAALSADDYAAMRRNAAKVGEALNRGEFLKKTLS